MNPIRVLNARFGVALPSGDWAVQIKGGDIATSRGSVPRLMSPEAPNGEDVLYLDATLDGARLRLCGTGAVVSHPSDRAWEWNGGWQQRGRALGTNATIWRGLDLYINRDGWEYHVLHESGNVTSLAIPGGNPSGFRRIGPDGDPIWCSDTYIDAARGLCEWTPFDGLSIGQGLDDSLVVRFDGEAFVRRIDGAGHRVRNVEVRRDADLFAIAWHQEDTNDWQAVWLTVEQLRACPAADVSVPALPVEVKDFPAAVDFGVYKVWPEHDPEPGDDWKDFDIRQWPYTHAFVETEREIEHANSINFPVITTPALARKAKNLLAIRLGQERDARTHDEMIAAHRALSVELDRSLLIYIDKEDPRVVGIPSLMRPGDILSWPAFALAVTETPDTTLARAISVAGWALGRGVTHFAPAGMAFDRLWAWPVNALANHQSVMPRFCHAVGRAVVAVTDFSLGRSGVVNGVRRGGIEVHKAEMLPWHLARSVANPDGPFRWPRPSQFTTPVPTPIPNPPTPPAPGPSPVPVPIPEPARGWFFFRSAS